MAYQTIIGPSGAREILTDLKTDFERKSSFEYDKVIDIAFRDMQEKFGFKNMNIFLLDSNDEKLIGYRLFNPEISEEINRRLYQMPIELANEPGVVKYILQKRVTVYVPEITLDMISSPWGREIFLMTGMQGNLMLPLTIDDVVCGLITFPSYSVPLQLSPEQIEDVEHRVLYISIALNSMFYALELKEKNQIIENKNRLQRDFMANVSHEIRTPMNAIIGFCGLALESPLTPKQTDYLKKIETSAESLMGVVNDILDFAKIEAGKLEIVRVPFNLVKILARVDDSVALKAAKNGLKLAILCDQGIPSELLGDPLRLGQVLINLVGNAVKFTPAGHVHLRLELVDKQADHCRIRFVVDDSGIGMTPEQIARLFTAFSQTDSSITRKYGGTGLGLIISKQLIELMGGKIRVESLVGRGSTFSFTLDFSLSLADDKAFLLPPDTSKIGATDIARIAGARILLVEDNSLNQQLATELLTDAGLRIDAANNGSEAIEALCRREYDLVLMDVQMPVMGGLEATQIIRRNLAWRRLPIVAMTAHAMQGYREECLAAGMNDYLSKPYNTAELFAILLRWITPRTSAAAVPSSRRSQPAHLPEQLPGLDVSEGITRMCNNRLLYIKLLQGFGQAYGDCIAQTKEMLASGNMDDVARLMHSLKGLAGSISARDVYLAAVQLEKAVKQGHVASDDARVSALEQSLQIVLQSIATTTEGAKP